MAAEGVSLNHVARESSDVDRLAQFYQEIFGFERVESPKFEFKVIWLKQSPSFYLHLIERDPSTKLPEGPWSANAAAVANPNNLPRGHHLCFSVSNFDSLVKILKVTPSMDSFRLDWIEANLKNDMDRLDFLLAQRVAHLQKL